MFLKRHLPQWINSTSGTGQLWWKKRRRFLKTTGSRNPDPAWPRWSPPHTFLPTVNVVIDNNVDFASCFKWEEQITFTWNLLPMFYVYHLKVFYYISMFTVCRVLCTCVMVVKLFKCSSTITLGLCGVCTADSISWSVRLTKTKGWLIIDSNMLKMRAKLV